MAGRAIPLVTGEYYHIFNRGVARQQVFITQRDYQRALLTLDYYRYVDPPLKLSKFNDLTVEEKIARSLSTATHPKLVDVISYVFMPNHIHLLLKQTFPGGISKYMSQTTNSYTRYFNTVHNRPGPIFQGSFKSVHVETNEQLLHLSRYIHLNPYVSKLTTKNEVLSYPWSSISAFQDKADHLSEPGVIISQLKSSSEYVR